MVIVENGANQEESSNSILSDNEELDAVISNPSPASLMDRSSVDPEETLVNDDISASEILTQQPGPSGVKRYGDWGSYSPAKLRTPKSGPLIPKIKPSDGAKKPSKNKITNKVTTWLESKTECVNFDSIDKFGSNNISYICSKCVKNMRKH